MGTGLPQRAGGGNPASREPTPRPRGPTATPEPSTGDGQPVFEPQQENGRDDYPRVASTAGWSTQPPANRKGDESEGRVEQVEGITWAVSTGHQRQTGEGRDEKRHDHDENQPIHRESVIALVRRTARGPHRPDSGDPDGDGQRDCREGKNLMRNKHDPTRADDSTFGHSRRRIGARANACPEDGRHVSARGSGVAVDRRAVAGWIGVLAVAGLVWCAVAGPLAPSPIPTGDRGQIAGLTAQVTGPAGDVLYTANCAACHGAGGGGTPNGPALTQSGAAAVDFMLRTGRMPLPAPGQSVRRGQPAFDEAAIQALVAYVAGFGDGPAIPNVQVTSASDIAAGRAAYVATCAACHGAGAGGDAVGGGAVAPPLLDTEPTQVGEAIRVGPGAMPAFNADQVSDEQLAEIAAYLQFLRTKAAPGGATVGGAGPVGEGYVGWLVYLIGLVLVTRWIERRRHR